MKNILFLMALMIPSISCQDIPTDKQAIATFEDDFSDLILQATLFIDVKTIQSDVMSVEHSIGTLVQHQGEVYVITHNHFSDLLKDTSTVEFRDAENRMIIPVYASEFKSRIVYQDPGTLVLRAPGSLADALTPVMLETQAQLEPGEIVQIAHRREPNGYNIEILEAVIEEINTFESTPVYILRSLDDQYLAPGDSGSGVWFDGGLIANNWAIIPKHSALTTSGNHNSASETQTDLSLAAISPDLSSLSNHTTP